MPEQALTLDEALRGFTTGAAYASNDDEVGRVVPGALADFTVLERDPYEIAPDELHTLRSLATCVAGAPGSDASTLRMRLC